MLPAIMVKSIIITLVMGVLLHGFTSWLEMRQKEEHSRLRIGYVAEEDMLTKLLVSYVAGMDSVDKWCRFVSVTEEEGREELANVIIKLKTGETKETLLKEGIKEDLINLAMTLI